jgi:hypothetical protein
MVLNPAGRMFGLGCPTIVCSDAAARFTKKARCALRSLIVHPALQWHHPWRAAYPAAVGLYWRRSRRSGGGSTGHGCWPQQQRTACAGAYAGGLLLVGALSCTGVGQSVGAHTNVLQPWDLRELSSPGQGGGGAVVGGPRGLRPGHICAPGRIGDAPTTRDALARAVSSCAVGLCCSTLHHTPRLFLPVPQGFDTGHGRGAAAHEPLTQAFVTKAWPWLAVGCVSPRTLYHAVANDERSQHNGAGPGPERRRKHAQEGDCGEARMFADGAGWALAWGPGKRAALKVQLALPTNLPCVRHDPCCLRMPP